VQGLRDFPRQNLSEQQVLDLVQNLPTIEITYGADLLDMQLNVVMDLTPYMSEGSSIARGNYDTIHGTCELIIDSDAPIAIYNQLVRPWQRITDPATGVSAQFYLGVYTLTSPTLDSSRVPTALSYSGYDLLSFLNQPIGDTKAFIAGSNPIDNCVDLIGEALPNTSPTTIITATTKTLASDSTYPFDSSNQWTYLDAVNDQLSQCGYRAVWVDWLGQFHLEPYITPRLRNSEFVFDISSLHNIVAESRSSDQDLFDVPNWWRFVMNGIQGSPVEGTNQYTFIDNDPMRSSSFVNRGYYVKVPAFVDAADYDALKTIAQIAIDADLSPVETFNVSTSPFPLAWHFDQLFIIDPNLSNPYRRVQAKSWELFLDGTSDSTWVLEAV
jgi:hypothetical protein